MKEEAKLLVNLEYEERIIEQKNIAKRGTSYLQQQPVERGIQFQFHLQEACQHVKMSVN